MTAWHRHEPRGRGSGTLMVVDALGRWKKTRKPEHAEALAPDADLEAAFVELRRAKELAQQKRRLAKLPEDPRVAAFLVECVEQARWSGSSAKPLWVAIFAKLVKLGDVRAVPRLRACVDRPPRFQGAAHTAWVLAQIAATADSIAKAWPELAAAAVLPPANPADAWIARVWAAPDDDALRTVAGDALQELGDPWGDFIAAATPEDQAKLARKHGKRFAGPLADVAAVSAMTFERGFVATLLLGRDMVGKRFWDDVARAPHWATVRAVELKPSMVPEAWFATWYSSAPLARLREVRIGKVVLTRASATSPWISNGARAPSPVSTYNALAKALDVGAAVTA